MERNTKKAITRNRVKILNLDYFDLTAPLLAAEVLTTKKHKDIKTEATSNKARIDLLLEWLDESAPGEAFPAFLQGIRNCKELILAKRIKREASEGNFVGSGTAPLSGIISNAKQAVSAPSSQDLLASLMKPKKKAKVKKDVKKDGPIVNATAVPFNGLPSTILPPFPLPSGPSTPASRKRKSVSTTPRLLTASKPPKTPANLNGTPKPMDLGDTKGKVFARAPAPPKAATPTAATPRTTRKSSSSDKGDDAATKGKKKATASKPKIMLPKTAAPLPNAAGPSSSPNTKPSGKAAVAKAMTFKQVEEKQQNSRQKFKFKNSTAVAKVIHFKDKTDISYLGCPFEESSKICEKKVELKSKEFVCESRHRSPNCKQIPRLYITCNDGTADLQLILLKNNVEKFCGKSAADLGTLSVNEIKDSLDKTIGKKLSVEVNCEKMKKATKKASIPNWNNVATILGDEEGPPTKKKRKN